MLNKYDMDTFLGKLTNDLSELSSNLGNRHSDTDKKIEINKQISKLSSLINILQLYSKTHIESR